MPEVEQYMFKYSEILEVLIKKADLHEGKWQLVMNFGLSAANIGPSPEEVVPGAAIGVLGIGLARAKADSPPGLVGDAETINPAST
jgi:hypothetical protein